MRLSTSAKGTFVFDNYKDDAIQISTLENGMRQAPIKMDSVINKGKWTAHPFIAPDDSYLIWDSERESGYGSLIFLLVLNKKMALGGAAINLGDKINSEFADAYGSVSSDGKYFFFHRSYGGDTGDIFWVDAQIIEVLRKNEQ